MVDDRYFDMNDIMLFGSGPMAKAYSDVLNSLNVSYQVFGRGEESAKQFFEQTGINVIRQSPSTYYGPNHQFGPAIIAVSNQELAPVTTKLIKLGVKDILVEKPAGITIEEVTEIAELSQMYSSRILIGLNRRFYASTIKAKEIIKADGGVTSCLFQFTEWVDSISKTYPSNVYKTWVVSNPIHVLDHFINFCGRPSQFNSVTSGDQTWHPTGSVFTGAGVTEKEIPFSYHANWESAGRWSVELFTKNRKLIFCPMEKLSQIKKNSTLLEDVQIDDTLDLQFKPGIYRQTTAFLNGSHHEFCDINNHLTNFKIYYKIGGYTLP